MLASHGLYEHVGVTHFDNPARHSVLRVSVRSPQAHLTPSPGSLERTIALAPFGIFYVMLRDISEGQWQNVTHHNGRIEGKRKPAAQEL